MPVYSTTTTSPAHSATAPTTKAPHKKLKKKVTLIPDDISTASEEDDVASNKLPPGAAKWEDLPSPLEPGKKSLPPWIDNVRNSRKKEEADDDEDGDDADLIMDLAEEQLKGRLIKKKEKVEVWGRGVQVGGGGGEGIGEGDVGSGEGTPDMEVFSRRVPVPMEVPGRKLAAGRKPWFYANM